MKHRLNRIGVIISSVLMIIATTSPAQAAYRFSSFRGRPPIHQYGAVKTAPQGMNPSQVKTAYQLPTTGGQGTIAIIDAYDDPTIEPDLGVFDTQFQLASCTTANGCFEKHTIGSPKANSGWALETSLDVEWAHAIAPQAKILLVEAATPSGKNLLAAIDYATHRADVVAVSMSWGGAEFSDEATFDAHFTSASNRITFFASSGDDGTGASWPAASPNVVAVGGTKLTLATTGVVRSEKAWSGSGGGVSTYEPEPAFQQAYAINRTQGHRAIPDVAYNADPASGYAVYKTTGKSKKGWYVLGGTSAGAPQWAAIKALSGSADNQKFYADKAAVNSTAFFRDIRSGKNGDCVYYCQARKHYDYVTGLGSPLTSTF